MFKLLKHPRNILIFAIVILAAGILVPVARHFQLRSATNVYISRLRAEGEPMDLAQVLPPPVPGQRNSTKALVEAFTLMDADNGQLATNFYGIEMMKMVAPGKAMVCSQEPDDKEFNVTNSWQGLTAAVAQNQEIFALLQQTIDRPDADFGIQYSCGVYDLNLTNLYLAVSKRAAQRLSAALMCDLHNGNTASAARNLRAVLGLVKTLRDDRLLITELVRMAIARIAITANWEVLQSSNLTDDELAQLQSDWEKFDFIQNTENTLAMERVIGEITVGKWRASNSELERIMTIERNVEQSLPFTNKESLRLYLKTTPKIVLWREWWSYPDELRALKGYDVAINAMRLAQTNRSFLGAIQYQNDNLNTLTNSNLEFVSDESDFHWLYSDTIELEGVIRRVMAAETAKQIVITAIALKRYHLKHGEYPAALDAMVPGFLSTVPPDPADGKPLHYRRDADGTFVLYSVGPNGRDDGGNPVLEKDAESESLNWLNNQALDWVWPSPVSGVGTNAVASP